MAQILYTTENGGEAANKRNNMHLHGGQQEKNENGEWEAIENPKLECTYGCIRIADADIKKMKEITDELERKDKTEKGNYFYVNNNLDKNVPDRPSGDPFDQTYKQLRKSAWNAVIQFIYNLASSHNIPIYIK